MGCSAAIHQCCFEGSSIEGLSIHALAKEVWKNFGLLIVIVLLLLLLLLSIVIAVSNFFFEGLCCR